MALRFYELMVRQTDDGSVAYHVQLADKSKDAFGVERTDVSQALTPEQAKALGFDLPDIHSAINTALMNDHAALQTQVAALQAANAQLEADNAELKTQIDALQPEPALAAA